MPARSKPARRKAVAAMGGPEALRRGKAERPTAVRGSSLAAERTRQEILAATIDVIAEHSLSGTTIERVAAAAGIAAGTVILHFKRKEALLVSALEHIAQEFDAARREAVAATDDDPAEALMRIADLYLDPDVSSLSKVAVWYAFWGEAGSRRVYMSCVARFDQDNLNDVTRLCGRLIEREGQHHLDVAAVAKAYAGLLEYFWQDMLSFGAAFDRDQARATALAFLTGLFPAAFGPDAPAP